MLIMQKRKIGYIIGDETDVLSRLIQCGELVQATDIFRTTSESPFPYFEMINMVWDNHTKNQNDATFLDEIIDGCSMEIIKLNALQESHNLESQGIDLNYVLCTLEKMKKIIKLKNCFHQKI